MAIPLHCTRCNLALDKSNRLVTEHCGHSKCRSCLILDKSECRECMENTINPSSVQFNSNTGFISNVKDKILILEDLSLSNGHLNTQEQGGIHKIKTERRRTKIPDHIETSQSEDGKIKYLCTICNKYFYSRTQQYYHLFCDNKQNKPYKCKQCTKSFSSQSHLKYHLEGHQLQSFSCKLCAKTFTKLTILRKHEKLHGQEKKTCNECGMQFKDKTAFAGHQAKHQNVFQFSCEICTKKFSLKSSLHQHRTNHLDDKKFQCSFCDKKFQRNYTLKHHILRHSRESSHSCSNCFKVFNDLSSLIRHSKIHEGNIMFKCTHCDISSLRKDNMIRHVRNMHTGEEFANCVEIITKEAPAQVGLPLPATETDETLNQMTTFNNTPKTIANSSVIKCIGNVQPIIIHPVDIELKSDNLKNTDFTEQLTTDTVPVAKSKKIKKKYDPFKIYRKILNNDEPNTDEDDDDEEEDLATEIKVSNVVDRQTLIATQPHSSHNNLLNFTEIHWRKNLNLRVREDWQ